MPRRFADRVRAAAPGWARVAHGHAAAALRGRPRSLGTLAAYRARHPGRWIEAIPAQAVPGGAARWMGAEAVRFGLEDAAYPPLGVIDLGEGSVVGPQGWAFTAEGEMLPECSWYGSAFGAAQLPRAYPPALRLAGCCVSLASDFAGNNYGHFLLDCLPRLGIVAAAGIELGAVDHFYLPRPPGRTAQQLLDALGVPREKCIWADRARRVRADRLLVTSFPGRRRDYPPSTAAFLRSALAPAGGGDRRIFVRREGARSLVNETELIAIARSHGFEAHDPRQIADEPGFFAQAGMVAGAHGAGLAGIVFCPPGATLLELIPSDHAHPYYFTLARAAGLQYAGLVGESLGSRAAGTEGPSPFDFRVDPEAFEAALTALTR